MSPERHLRGMSKHTIRTMLARLSSPAMEVGIDAGWKRRKLKSLMLVTVVKSP